MVRAGWFAAAVIVTMGATAALAQPAAIERGKKVYAEQRCSVCHSIGGAGNKRGPLDTVGTTLTADQIRRWIVDAEAMTAETKAERKPPMKSYGNLPKEDVEALVAYMASLKK